VVGLSGLLPVHVLLTVDAKPMCGQWLMTKIRPLLLRIFDFHELLEFVLEVLSIFKIENQEREVH
jgi:hypothetical protein